MEQTIADWIEACPYACHSYIDENGDVVITVIIDDD